VITIVTTLIIMIISGNLILSLGMVGALSIVRFRTPIKDPIDLVFIFWAISVGISNGVSYFNISVIGSIFLAIVLLALARSKNGTISSYLLILEVESKFDINIFRGKLKDITDRFKLKSQTITDNSKEIIFEVCLKDDGIFLIQNLKNIDKVYKVTLINLFWSTYL